MDNKGLLELILTKEGANEAFQELSTQFNINDSTHLRQNWTAVEDLLLNFRFKRYSISQDFLLSETVVQPFKSEDEVRELKKYLFN
ncbi:hypothetical protein GZH53_13905 [Flavihumibacter sp. R14]|nr:hypothetical protein [Flavihumibacter soli]